MKKLKGPLFLFLITLTGCGGGGGGGGGGGVSAGPADDSAARAITTSDGVTFSEMQQGVIAPRCARCHADFQNQASFNQRIAPGSPEGSQAFLLAENGTMPLGGPPLTSAELEVMRLYIEDAGNASALMAEEELNP